MADDVTLDVKANTDQADKSFKKLDKTVDKFAKDSVKSFGKMDAAIASFAGNLGARAVSAGFTAIANAASGLFDTFTTEGVAAAKIQEDAINALNIALKASGTFTEQASLDFQEFASGLQQASRFGDELILKNAALIQSLGQLSGDGLKEATQAAADMSAALGIDLTAAATLVGKAAAGEIGSFSRYGLIIKKGADNAETFANALEGINSKFGGAAAGQVNTFAGANEQLSNTYGDLQEVTGSLITQNPLFVKGISLLNKAFLDAQNFVKDNEKAIISFANNGLLNLLDAFSFTLKALDLFTRGWKVSLNVISIELQSFALLAVGSFVVVEKGVNALISRIPFLSDKFGELNTGVSDIFDSLKKSIQEDASDIGEAIQNKGALGEAAEGIENFSSTLRGELEKDNEAAQKSASIAQDASNKKVEAKKEELAEITKLREEFAASEAELALIKNEADTLKADEDFAFLQEQLGTQEALRLTAQVQAQKNADKAQALRLKNRKKGIDAEIKQETIKSDFVDLTFKEQVKGAQTTADLLVQFASASSKKQGGIFKAAATAKAAIDGTAAIQAALVGPFPLNLVNSAIIAGITAQNISKINSAPAFEQGGIVGGNSFSGDNVAAQVNSGEMILNRSQQTTLFNAVDRGEIGGGTSIVIQGNVIADDETAVSNLMDRIRDQIEFRNESLAV